MGPRSMRRPARSSLRRDAALGILEAGSLVRPRGDCRERIFTKEAVLKRMEESANIIKGYGVRRIGIFGSVA